MSAVDDLNFLADIIGETLPHMTIPALKNGAVAQINAAFSSIKDTMARQSTEIDKLKHVIERQQQELVEASKPRQRKGS